MQSFIYQNKTKITRIEVHTTLISTNSNLYFENIMHNKEEKKSIEQDKELEGWTLQETHENSTFPIHVVENL